MLCSFSPASVTHLYTFSFAFLFFFSSSILLTMCSSFILITWPYYFQESFFGNFSYPYVTLVVPLMCSFLIVTQQFHLSILISFTPSRPSLHRLVDEKLLIQSARLFYYFLSVPPPPTEEVCCKTCIHCSVF